MRDMIPKGTGNSRFLKSSIPEGVTWEQFINLWRSGKFPVDFAGLNEDGINVLGSAYNKGNVLPDTVCTRLDISTSSEPKDAFLALSNKGGWKEIDRITISKTWTVPAGVTQIGVLAIGGGESGALANVSPQLSPTSQKIIVSGGFAGHISSGVLNVLPGQKFNITIGSGGVAHSHENSYPYPKTPGGDTIFSGNGANITAKGGGVYANGVKGGSGVGIQVSDPAYIGGIPELFQQSGFNSNLKFITLRAVGSGSILNYAYSFSDYCFLFTDIKVLSPGGSIYVDYSNDVSSPNIVEYPSVDLGGLGRGGDAIVHPTSTEIAGKNATGYGNGGGSVVYRGKQAVSGKAGDGSPGIVIIYA